MCTSVLSTLRRLVLATTLFLIGGTASAITIGLSDDAALKGDNVTSFFTVGDYGSLGISSFTFGVFYDDAFVEYVGTALGAVLDNENEFFNVSDNGFGLLMIQFSDTEGVSLPNSPPTPSPVLFSLTFKILETAVGNFSLLETQGLILPLVGDQIIFDSTGDFPSAQSATLAIVPVPGAVWLLLSASGLLLTLRRRSSVA